MKILAISFRCCMPLKGQTTVFARLSAPPNECRMRCYKARGKVCDLLWVTSGGKFNMRRRCLALAGPPKSAKNRGVGVCLFKTVRLIGRIRYIVNPILDAPFKQSSRQKVTLYEMPQKVIDTNNSLIQWIPSLQGSLIQFCDASMILSFHDLQGNIYTKYLKYGPLV